jgi:hypothetical protein
MFFLVLDQFWRINDAFHNLMGTGNIVLQLIVLGMLMMSLHSKRKGDLIAHGNLMILAVITNFVSVTLVMLTGFVYFYVSEPLSLSYRFSVLHGVIGGLAMLLAFWLTIPWVVRGSNMKVCTRKKGPMRATYLLWVAALIMGLIVWVLDVVLAI